MLSKVQTAHKLLSKVGLKNLLIKIYVYVSTAPIRLYSSTILKKSFGNIVAYGPFKGMKLGEESWWGLFDQSPMILGTYEKHVQERMVAESSNRHVFIDIGAADGFFGIGAVTSGLFEKSYCFEISKKGQTLIKKNALLNNVSEQIEVHGEANQHTLLSILSLYHPSEVLILCDIEGAEYDFLDHDLLEQLAGTSMIIELHEFIENGTKRAQELISRAKKVHVVDELKEIPIDLTEFKVLESLGSNSRLLAISEGRPEAMRWITLSPKNLSH